MAMINGQSAFPAIYDFSLLPYALGDVLTWTVKTCMRAIEHGFQWVDLYICADNHEPSFHYQKTDINILNYQSYFAELFPAFLCNPMLRDVHLFFDRDRMLKALEDAGEETRLVLHEFLSNRAVSFKGKDFSHYINKNLKSECSGHSDINRFYELHKQIPKLGAPKGFLPEAERFRERLGAEAFVVCIQFRLRSFDTYLPNSEPERDSDFVMWYQFIRNVHARYPNVKFVLVGRLQEKPAPLLSLPNVIVPRLYGFGLGHELALLTISDLFFGTSSGFAAMANFCDVPYVITRVGESAYANYGVPVGHSHLPFAHENQLLVPSEESLEMLLEWFGKMYSRLFNRQLHRRNHTEVERPDIPNSNHTTSEFSTELTPTYFAQIEQAMKQIRLVAVQAMTKAGKLIYTGKIPEALQTLDNAWTEFPDVVAGMPGFHLTRAIALQRLSRWKECEEAIALERLFHPNNLDACEFQITTEFLQKAAEQSELIKKGNEALEQGAFDLARQTFMHLTELHPNLPEGYIGLGYAWAGLGRMHPAKIALEKASGFSIRNSNLLNLLGIGFHRIGEHAKAIEVFEQTLNLDASNLAAHNNLAILACKQNRPEDGLKYFERALQHHPNDPDLLVNFARLAKILKKMESADSAFRKAAQLGSDLPEVRQWLSENPGRYSGR